MASSAARRPGDQTAEAGGGLREHCEEAEDGEDLAVHDRLEVVADQCLQEQSKNSRQPGPRGSHCIVGDELPAFMLGPGLARSPDDPFRILSPEPPGQPQGA